MRLDELAREELLLPGDRKRLRLDPGDLVEVERAGRAKPVGEGSGSRSATLLLGGARPRIDRREGRADRPRRPGHRQGKRGGHAPRSREAPARRPGGKPATGTSSERRARVAAPDQPRRRERAGAVRVPGRRSRRPGRPVQRRARRRRAGPPAAGRLGERLERRDGLHRNSESAAEAPGRREPDANAGEGARPRAHGDAVALRRARMPGGIEQAADRREKLLGGAAIRRERLPRRARRAPEGRRKGRGWPCRARERSCAGAASGRDFSIRLC